LGALKIPTAGMSASEGTITFRAHNLAASFSSHLIDLFAASVNIYASGAIGLNDGGGSVIGINASTLTGWDLISLAWKSDRLSLVINDAEVCYITDPDMPDPFPDYLYIGTDYNGAIAINTLVDELRIDKVYRDVAIRAGWHKTGVPFYTSEDMKQWPGYIRAETDGVAIYDSEGNLRVKLGSWLEDLLREYGLMIIGGKIYSSLIRTGLPGNAQYIAFEPPNRLVMYAPQTYGSSTPVKVLEMASPNVAEKAGIDWYDAEGTLYAQIVAQAVDNKMYIYGEAGVNISNGLNAVILNLINNRPILTPDIIFRRYIKY